MYLNCILKLLDQWNHRAPVRVCPPDLIINKYRINVLYALEKSENVLLNCLSDAGTGFYCEYWLNHLKWKCLLKVGRTPTEDLCFSNSLFVVFSIKTIERALLSTQFCHERIMQLTHFSHELSVKCFFLNWLTFTLRSDDDLHLQISQFSQHLVSQQLLFSGNLSMTYLDQMLKQYCRWRVSTGSLMI